MSYRQATVKANISRGMRLHFVRAVHGIAFLVGMCAVMADRHRTRAFMYFMLRDMGGRGNNRKRNGERPGEYVSTTLDWNFGKVILARMSKMRFSFS